MTDKHTLANGLTVIEHLANREARITALEAERAELVGWLAMAVAEMSRARGRLETIAGCNEDRRIAAALGRTCDCARAILTKARQSEGEGQ